MSFISKNKYKIFKWGKEYIVSDECIEELKKLDEYKEYIFGYKPTMMIPIIIISFLINLPFYFMEGYKQEDDKTLLTAFLIYVAVNLIFYLKLRLAINCKNKKSRGVK